MRGRTRNEETQGLKMTQTLVQKREIKTPHFAYLGRIGKTVPKKRCPGYFMTGECSQGHQFATLIHCEKEWCPVCSEKGSTHHRKKVGKWLPKAQSYGSMGYWVFTIPEKIRWKYKTKRALSDLSSRIVNGDKSRHIEGVLKQQQGYTNGFLRWHFYSEMQPGKYNPHLNVIVEGGFISLKKIEKIRKAWAKILGCKVVNIDYGYKTTVAEKTACLQYVTRSTFLNEQWDEKLAHELYGFRNMRVFGKFSGEIKWELGMETEKEVVTRKLDNSICPVCGELIEWNGGVGDILQLDTWSAAGWAHKIAEGYFRLIDREPLEIELERINGKIR